MKQRTKNKEKLNFLKIFQWFFVFLIILFIISLNTKADIQIDTDGDKICDDDEINIYKTDINNSDTDGDGFDDWVELNSGYSPLTKEALKLEDCDFDNDGLSDRMELNFHTEIDNSDTDGDGFDDGIEIDHGYDPKSADPIKLEKRIEINTGLKHELSYFLGDVRMGKFLISAGLAYMPTPKGHFKIDGKHPNAWSSYGLWMPYWMSFKDGKYGIHQLPYWPNGWVEGEDHLGKPASHGCVRLGKIGAEFLYNWAEIGTPVFIY